MGNTSSEYIASSWHSSVRLFSVWAPIGIEIVNVSTKSIRIASCSGVRFSSKHSKQVIVSGGIGSGIVSLITMILFSLSLLFIQTNLKQLLFCLYPL